MRRRRGPYRDGKVHVMSERCSTCIFRAGNIMRLQRGRVAQMVRDAQRQESAIICHDTLDGKRAVCRGFFDRYATAPLQIAERMGLIEYQKPERSKKGGPR